jgi:hypothetical protein
MENNMIKILLLLILVSTSCFNNFISPFDNNHNHPENNDDSLNIDTIIIIDTIEYPSADGRLSTYFTEDWDKWEIEFGDTIGILETNFSEDWDSWNFTINGITGIIRTYYSEDWDNWELSCEGYNIRIKTYFSDDWDRWEISDTDHDVYLSANTYFSDDYDHWEIYNSEIDLEFATYFSEDWDNWELWGDIQSIETPYLIACAFIPIFTSSVYIQGITEE